MRVGWKGTLGIAISALLIWWSLRGVSLTDVWAALKTGNLWLLGAAVAVATAGFLLRAFRWQVLLTPVNPNTSLNSRFGATMIGFMANNILPARVGEFVRVYALSRMEAVTMSAGLGTLVVERVLDGATLLLFLVLPVFLPGFPASGDSTVRTLVAGALLFLAVIFTVLIVLLAWPAHVVRLAERVAARMPGGVARRAVDALEAFLDALMVMRRPGLLVRAVVWSVVFWTWHGLSFYLAMAAFGIHEGFPAALFTEATVGFGVALPSAPGFFGTFHYAAKTALESVYGVAPAPTLAFAYGYHLGGWIPVTLIGLWYMRRVGLSFAEMGRSEASVEGDVEASHPEAAALLRTGHAPERPSSAPRSATSRALRGKEDGGRPSVVELDAPAKVNLFLRVLGREPSGYHAIETLFQSVELSDRVRAELTSDGRVDVEVLGLDAGPVEDNLVRRAAIGFLATAGVGAGVRLRLDKRIPVGGGLGGGSSDAAATLRALDRLFPGVVSNARLLDLGARLGSDVPFFLCGSPLALGEGRGEKLTELPALPPAHLILAFPDDAISTAWAYRALDEHRSVHGRPARPERGFELRIDPRRLADWEGVARLGVNDFEQVVLPRYEQVATARDALAATSPRLVLMSGSGSSVFALYDRAEAARSALDRVSGVEGVQFVLTRTRTQVAEPALVGSGG